MRTHIILYSTLLALSACGGGGGGNNDPAPEVLNTDYSSLQFAALTNTGLSTSTGQANIETFIKNGLRLRLADPITQSPRLLNDQPFTLAPANTEDNANNPASGTTLQVDGVEEADQVKYDGQYIFTLNQEVLDYRRPNNGDDAPTFSFIAPAPSRFENTLTIVATDASDASTREVATYTLDEEDAGATLMYRIEGNDNTTDYLAAISQTYYYDWRVALTDDNLTWHGGKTTVQLLDVRDPLNVNEAWKLEIEGNFEDSRRIGNILYLVSRHVPELQTLNYDPQTEQEQRDNERRILHTPINTLLPRYQSNDALPQPLVNANECLIPATAKTNQGYADILVITAIDLVQQNVIHATCLNTSISGLYVSSKSLYIGGNIDNHTDQSQSTLIHKFSLNEGNIAYQASGQAQGHLSWTNPSFFMDEHNDDLRIVTTTRTAGIPQHHLTVMRQIDTGNSLDVIAELPNEQQPAPIGKPEEDIYATRFWGDRAYIVTFRRIDPLYVIDLSKPTQPTIAGELAIPGFSTFLQPLASDYLLSIGRDATDAGVTQGVKVELFDITDINAPTSVNAFTFGQSGSWSDAIYDHHAITFLHRDNGEVRLGLPVSVYDTPTDNARHSWSYNGLHLLEATGLKEGTPSLRFQGVLKAEERSETGNTYPNYVSSQRSFLHDDAVFYIYGDKVFSSLWGELSSEK